MLQCVPAPFPDEIARGYAQRIWARSGGSLTASNRLLPMLAEVTGLSELQLLRQHSHLGYMRMVSVAHAGLDMSCHADRWSNPVILHMRPPIDRARFCPSCVSEDIGFHGVAYWRRAHQLPGLSVCTKHAAILLEVSNDWLMRSSPGQCPRAIPALKDSDVDDCVGNRLIERFVALSDMALQLTTPIAAAVVADVLSERKRSIDGARRGGLATMVRDVVPESWLVKHFPALLGRDKDDRAASIDDVLRSRHVAHATKSYLLAMATLWDNPEDAMRTCMAGAQVNADGFDLAGGSRAVTAVLNGMSIRAACRIEGIHLRDFEHALRSTSNIAIPTTAPSSYP